MGKILDAEFRNGLYKSLVEAGYDKNEAKIIVGKKYYGELKADLIEKVKVVADSIEKDVFEELPIEAITEGLSELKKLKTIVG